MFTIFINQDSTTPKFLKPLFSRVAGVLTYDIRLWLYCIRLQFNTTDEVDRSWKLHSFILKNTWGLSHDYDTIIRQYTQLTGEKLAPSDGSAFVDNAIVRFAPSAACDNSDNICRSRAMKNSNF
jgi:hypothetical protein